MKISLIVTILNEAHTIELLLGSILAQTHKPDEVIVVDGGSDDGTLDLARDYLMLGGAGKLVEGKESSKKMGLNRGEFQIDVFGVNFVFLQKKGNRSVGRNWAVQRAKGDWLAITDAGCILDKNWLEEMVKVAKQKSGRKKGKVDVVAGYYNSDPLTALEEAIVPYVLVMPDRVNEDAFLPATRSMMMKRGVWEKLGGFDESLSDNEDYAFARRIEPNGFEIKFARKAVVTWIPRGDLQSFGWMIFRFARGDVQAGIWRPKVVSIFVRYLFLLGLPPLFAPYLIWSIWKNKKYLKKFGGWYYLPVLQVLSDVMVMWGSVCGVFRF